MADKKLLVAMRQHVQELQDKLLPALINRSSHAWLASSRMEIPNHRALWSYLAHQTEQAPIDIDRLNKIPEKLGIHDLLQDIAESPEAKDDTPSSCIPT